jgi:gamma-glutamyltranspeptidase
MGADIQPLGQVQVIANLIDFDMNLQEAGDAPVSIMKDLLHQQEKLHNLMADVYFLKMVFRQK